MTRLTVAKFGGSAIGPFGEFIPKIIERIKELSKDSKVMAVFSAPLTQIDDKERSLTDVVLEIGRHAESGKEPNLDTVRKTYDKILEMVNEELKGECKSVVESFLEKSSNSLNKAKVKKKFADEIRSIALGFSGEILMSHVMNYILKSNGISSAAVDFEKWPIITDENIESTNFLPSESKSRLDSLKNLVEENDVVSIGGFIGRTVEGVATTYERGGSDRTAADLGILFHKTYETVIDFEKDSSVVSADPKIVKENLDDVFQLSYNEARLAGMFGMKILDPIAIKEIVDNGVDIPIVITNMLDPKKITTIKRIPDNQSSHPIKLVTGKKNCAIVRIEADLAQKLLISLEKDKRYSEFIILSPFSRDEMEFTRILFLDGDYVKRNERYLLGFDSLATITYHRGVITLIGDEMWRVQQVVSRTSARIGQTGMNILNMDAQEETSRIIIVVEDSGENIPKAIAAIHDEKSKFKFI